MCHTQQITVATAGAQVKLVLKIWRQVRAGELSASDADNLLEDYCICMVDPATGGVPTADGGITSEIALCPGGETRAVTADTLTEFFQLLARSWFGEVMEPVCLIFAYLQHSTLLTRMTLLQHSSGCFEAGCSVQRSSSSSVAA